VATTVRNPFSRKPAATSRISPPDACHACTPAPPTFADHQPALGGADDAARASAALRITRGLMQGIGWMATQWALPAMEMLAFA
jgi:hypothetical protein